MYALSARTRIALGKQTWLSGSAELSTLAGLAAALQGKMMGRQRREGGAVAGSFRGFVSLRHKMKGHDLIARAAWGEQCVDRFGRYWTLPRALSLDFASLVSREGLRYRFGLQHVGGKPEESLKPGHGVSLVVPWGAKAGTRAQAGMSLEGKVTVWKDRSVTAQLGMFERALFDHTLLNATLTCGSLSAAGYNLSKPASATSAPAPDATSAVASGATSAGWRREERGAPTLSLSFQQQIFGPVRGRWDACMGVDAKAPLAAPTLLDSTYALDCSLERLGAARLVVWYSPTRREGMAEVRLLDR
ncbi:unnamed protein product [Closterium sp. Yama58-4]|nr:unnamed protein product [Closterium sp. Yama58-4]